ncbi:MAG: hypothetical protein ACE5G0_19570 [Rhodothermales bacterium]
MCAHASCGLSSRSWLLILVFLGCLGSVQAQPLVRLVPNRAQIGLSFDGNWRDSGLGRSFSQNNFRERLVIPVMGALIADNFLRYSFELRPTFSQQRSSDLPKPFHSRDLGLSTEATLLSSSFIPLNVRWDKSSGIQSGGFGTQNRFDTSILSSTLSIRNPLLPMSVTVSRRFSDTEIQVGPDLLPVGRAENVRRLQASARNRKLDVTYDWLKFDDLLQENDHTTWNLSINHWLRWGKRSELNTRYLQAERKGNLPYARSSWSERLRLQHTMTTYTQFDYRRSRAEGEHIVTQEEGYGGSFTTRAGRELGFGVSASVDRDRINEGKRKTITVSPWLEMNVELPFGASLSAQGSVGFMTREQSEIEEELVPIFLEPHLVSQGLVVVLDRLFVDPASVVVLNANETLVFEEGLDYELITVGNLTEIHILVGSRIRQEDTILISYLYQPIFNPEFEEEGVDWSFNLGLRLAGFALQHAQSRRSTTVGGEDAPPILGDFENQSTSLSTNRRLPIGRIRFNLVRRRRKTATLSYVTEDLKVSYIMPPLKRFRISFDANGRRVREGDVRVTLLSISTSLSLDVGRTLHLRTTGRYQDWRQHFEEEGLPPTDIVTRFFTATSSLDYRIGRSTVKVRFNYDRRVVPLSSSGSRVAVSLTRRF